MILTSTGMLFFLQKLPNFFLRIAFFLRTNGEQLEFNKAVVGYTMLFTVLSHTLCCSGGHLIISNS